MKNQTEQAIHGQQWHADDAITVEQVGDVVNTGGGDYVARDKIVGFTPQDVAVLLVELKRVDQPKVWNGYNPYPGLRAFQETDAAYFFGRESVVVDLLNRVDSAQFIVVAGPSGSGKSSVVRAGLLHALRQGKLDGSDNWLLATMSPQGDPMGNLALGHAAGDAVGKRLAPGSSPRLLIIPRCWCRQSRCI